MIKKDIDASEKSLREILSSQYTLDYYQREYNWREEHVVQLIEDLEEAFLEYYKPGHQPGDAADYGTYYMGPVVFSAPSEKGNLAIVDGQQRLTTLSLILIYLEHRQKEMLDKGVQVHEIRKMIYDDHYGTKSFKIQDPDRETCMQALLDKKEYSANNAESMSAHNLLKQYENIVEAFGRSKLIRDNDTDAKEASDGSMLRVFLYWIINKVILVSIVAGTPDKAYLIFETMNDRGLRLKPAEMLKAYLISQVPDNKKEAINGVWKDIIKKLNDFHDDVDSDFFQAWLRGKYAEKISEQKKGGKGKNEDFEKIGTGFHVWVRDEEERIKPSGGWYDFIGSEMNFSADIFLQFRHGQDKQTRGIEHLYNARHLRFASSLFEALLFAPIKSSDEPETIKRKLNTVARYVETFCVLRAVNSSKYGHSAFRVKMYKLVTKIRDKSIEDLGAILKNDLSSSNELKTFDGIVNKDLPLRLQGGGQNRRFIQFFLAKLTTYIEQQSGIDSSLQKYLEPITGKPYQIEHIVPNKFERYKGKYDGEQDFGNHRNMIGGLVLVQQGTNQSYSDMDFKDKKGFYGGTENLLAASLHEGYYSRNPNFKNGIADELKFEPFDDFGKEAIWKRQELYKRIAEKVWDLSFFDQDD